MIHVRIYVISHIITYVTADVLQRCAIPAVFILSPQFINISHLKVHENISSYIILMSILLNMIYIAQSYVDHIAMFQCHYQLLYKKSTIYICVNIIQSCLHHTIILLSCFNQPTFTKSNDWNTWIESSSFILSRSLCHVYATHNMCVYVYVWGERDCKLSYKSLIINVAI